MSAAPVRDVVADIVKDVTAEAKAAEANPKAAVAKAKAVAAPSKAAGAKAAGPPPAPVNTEKIKAEKPKAAGAAKQGPAATTSPAQVPSPSMIGGIQPTTSMSAGGAAGSLGARAKAAPASTSPPVIAPRTQGAQMVGAAPGAKAPSSHVIASAGTKVASGYRVLAPSQAVEIVTRTPVPSSISAPPATAPLPVNMPQVGYAASLTQIGQAGMKAADVGPGSVPRVGPAAVAVGRSVMRGRKPVTMNSKGKPTTEIAKKYQIVFISSEVAPWSKSGGLGEAMDGLPIALAALGHRVMTISPRYDQYEEAWDTSFSSEVPMGKNMEKVHCFHTYASKVDRVFLNHDCFLAKVNGKSGAMLYGPEWGKDFADNQWRFMYFAKAVLKVIQELPLGGFPFGGDTIIACNDWHSSLVPVYLEHAKKLAPSLWCNAKSCILIHNAVFQGRFDRDDPEEPSDEIYGLPAAMLDKFTFKMPLKVGRTEVPIRRCLNWLGGAVQAVDRVITVSPTYAWELVNLPEMGVELDTIFEKKGVTGIVNGVKEAVSPMNAAFVKKCKMLSTFNVNDVDEKKAELKAMLQESYGLPVNPKIPLAVFVGRMDLQKGYDFLLAALAAILDTIDLQLIIIGTGRADLVASTNALAKKFPTKVFLAGWCGPERYAMVAGADYNMMPSRWEPCGLAQMESMRFGTLPVVAQTGGLIDTVQDMVTGLHMNGAVSVEKDLDPTSVELMAQVLEKCVKVYADTAATSKMRKAAMAAADEFTWSNSALQYEAVFEQMGAIDILPMCTDKTVTLTADNAVA